VFAQRPPNQQKRDFCWSGDFWLRQTPKSEFSKKLILVSTACWAKGEASCCFLAIFYGD
jgi:hypothetical protein